MSNRDQRVSAETATRKVLETKYGKVWNTEELSEEYEQTGSLGLVILVRRRSDGRNGSMEFHHSPRFYFHFKER